MSKSILVIDVSNLAYRAFYTTGGLSHEGQPTGVSFGVLREISDQLDLHNPDRVVFAFDYGGPGLRGEIYPDYKGDRKRTDEEEAARESLFEELRNLRRTILPDAGFRNIFRHRGYEADDIIATVALNAEPSDDVVILSTDKDLWQCLRRNVVCINPVSKKATTIESFRAEFGIDPVQWATVKAIVGGKDNITGIKGIGPKNAVKWITGQLKAGKKFEAIEDGLGIINQNLRLSTLPFPGLEIPELQEDAVTPKTMRSVFNRLGIRTVAAPGGFDI